MDRTIKLKDETYQNLETIRVKGETFSQVVERLIRVYHALTSASEDLLRKWSTAEVRRTGAEEK